MPDIAQIEIETERLILRPPSGEDFNAFALMSTDADTMRHIGGASSRSEAWRLWCTLAGSWVINGFGMFSMIEKSTGTWIGRTGPWQPADWPGTEVGWAVAPEYAGKGFALEAAVASMDYAFDVLGWDDVMHCINPDNAPSIALAKRIGSTNRGKTQMPEPFQNHPVDDWGQSREQWLENRKQFQ
ncbi:GNAT family N-acetyltransferase [Parasphingorhabdus halotolerans]|uniref:GNAT family N-acetyltransferase n=1 Tax=Parasphingorhabdus halotolerans TaxID=2725558 RepID=A0A6H2DN75_9SPHN|nr:GNAT family N-acetyltransferase [Parasphingorhabdus halotolerans]QJB69804.1 GNAT family N-acetyltransferase [Parasphingorhabdus halotolerans]